MDSKDEKSGDSVSIRGMSLAEIGERFGSLFPDNVHPMHSQVNIVALSEKK